MRLHVCTQSIQTSYHIIMPLMRYANNELFSPVAPDRINLSDLIQQYRGYMTNNIITDIVPIRVIDLFKMIYV